MSGTDRQRRHRDRVRLGLHVTRPVPDADLVFKLIELGYLTDAEVESRPKIDAALEAWLTQLVTP